MLPEFNAVGDLPEGVYGVSWQQFESRFGGTASRRVFLLGRLKALLQLASANGKLRRVFVWGSFVTAKPAPRFDVLLIMDDDFEVE